MKHIEISILRKTCCNNLHFIGKIKSVRLDIFLSVEKGVEKEQWDQTLCFTQLLDDQPRQYWIYANTDNELVTVHIKVDCE